MNQFENHLLIGTFRQSNPEDIDGQIEITPIRDGIVKIRYSERPFVETTSDSLVEFTVKSDWSVEETEQLVILTTPCLRLEINRSTCAFTWKTPDGTLITREPVEGGKWIQPIDVELTQHDGGAKVVEDKTVDGIKKRIIGEARKVVDRVAYTSTLMMDLQSDEAIYGLGQHEDGILDYSNRQQLLYQANMKVAIPTFLSSQGYAIHQDQHCLAMFESDGSTLNYWSEVVPQMEFFFIYGPEMDDLIRGIRLLTGQPPMLPLWAYGFVQSKERYESAEELTTTVRRFREASVPIDCIVLDWSSWEEGKWGEKILDPARFPDPKAMMDEIHALDAKLMVSIWPNPCDITDNNKELAAANCLLGNRTNYNPMLQDAREIYWKQAREGLFDHGVDAWWCDCSEPFERDWRGFLKQPACLRMKESTMVLRDF